MHYQQQDRLAIARHRAALEAERPRRNVVESHFCYFCDSGNHSMEECNVSRVPSLADPLESASENPSEGIHCRSLQACDLYWPASLSSVVPRARTKNSATGRSLFSPCNCSALLRNCKKKLTENPILNIIQPPIMWDGVDSALRNCA